MPLTDEMRNKFLNFAKSIESVQARTDTVVNDTLKACEDLKLAKERIKGLAAAKNNLHLENDKLIEDVKFWRDGCHESYKEKKELDESIRQQKVAMSKVLEDLEKANLEIAAERAKAEEATKALVISKRHLHEAQDELRTLVLSIGADNGSEEPSTEDTFDTEDPPTEGLVRCYTTFNFLARCPTRAPATQIPLGSQGPCWALEPPWSRGP